jgi:hypothetical protein
VLLLIIILVLVFGLGGGVCHPQRVAALRVLGAAGRLDHERPVLPERDRFKEKGLTQPRGVIGV